MESHSNTVLLKERAFRDMLCELAKNPTEPNAKALLDRIGGSYSLKGKPYTGLRWSRFRIDKIAERTTHQICALFPLLAMAIVSSGRSLLSSAETREKITSSYGCVQPLSSPLTRATTWILAGNVRLRWLRN